MKSKKIFNIIDAASLLTRIELIGGKPGTERWHSLLPLVKEHVNNHLLAFNDAHFSMILSKCKSDTFTAEKHQESLSNYIR